MRDLIHRQIGGKTVTVEYEPGGKEYAQQSLDRQQAEFEEATALLQLGLNGLVDRMQSTQSQLERLDINHSAYWLASISTDPNHHRV